MLGLSDRYNLLRALMRKHGAKALVKQFRYAYVRPDSRKLIQKHSPRGRGIEIGVGAQTIAPFKRTILSDAFRSHTKDRSLATEFFQAHEIPYANNSMDFILSEHVLEHVPNPIRVLKEWQRVLKPGGVVYLFMPHPKRTFDRNRALTPLEHLLEDERNDVNPSEDVHYEEWMNLVIHADFAPHYEGLSKEECLKTSSLHRHVWNEKTLAQLLEHLSFTVLYTEEKVRDRGDSFVVIARK